MGKENRDTPKTVADILQKIEEKAATGAYLYRGEPEHYEEAPYYGKVSSNLYREFLKDESLDIGAKHFDIEVIQEEVLGLSGKFSSERIVPLERLSEIQHYGGKTNLIDFTKDYLIALFMACDGSATQNGRLILQKKEEINPYIEEVYEPINRVIAQKSIFVRHPDGFIQPNEDDVINIPAELKKDILRHLRNLHGITVETVYNDIHGFIRAQNDHIKVYMEIYKGLTQEQKGDGANGDSDAEGTL